MSKKIAVLIPCYNESQTVAKVVSDFRAALPEADIYVFDNNSTDKTDEIVNFILHDLHSGASLYPVEGAYQRASRTEVVAIVDKQEYTKLMSVLQKTDPRAFVTVYSVNEVSYVPKR